MNALWQPADYVITITCPDDMTAVGRRLFELVWRTSLAKPGFAIVRFAAPTDSHELRRAMFLLTSPFPLQFQPERLGRFDQQVSSKFHRDGAPPESLLLLGYEPTTVRSRLFIADSSRAAAEAEMPLLEFVGKFNPMFPAGEARYLPFVTELALPHGEACIVGINNSQLPLMSGYANPLGVLHKAIVDTPDPRARRVINSVGLTPGVSPDSGHSEHFISRNDLD
jgi:hypothetical protein